MLGGEAEEHRATSETRRPLIIDIANLQGKYKRYIANHQITNFAAIEKPKIELTSSTNYLAAG